MEEVSSLHIGAEYSENEIIFGEEEIDALDLQPVEKDFEQYDKKPFLSFTNAALCDEETEELVFGHFKEWLITCQTEGFLRTFEPKPSLNHLSLGKCPYFHTEMTCKEREELRRRIEQEEKMKKELEQFLRKRLRLVQRLLIVYRKAKCGIEEEFIKNMTQSDPLCEFKRKMATRRIVDMMIKQFALEYLYLKSMKIKKEIEMINCILIDTGRSRKLKNMYKYTLKIAEKLRCLLEKECSDEDYKCEKFFEDKTLKDMARMYLNEIENMAASVPYLSADDWSSEEVWESTTSESCLPEYEGLSDFFESNYFIDDEQKVLGATSDGVSGTVEEEQKINLTTEKQEAIAEEELKHFQEENEKTLGILKMDFEDEPLLRSEDSQNVFEEIKKEILKQDYSLEGEELVQTEEETSEEDIRLAQLEINKAEIEMLEEFKRELWLMESFHFFTSKLRPELSGKYKLVHFKSIYDESIKEEVDEETVTSDMDSSIDTDLESCLKYLKAGKSSLIRKSSKDETLESYKGKMSDLQSYNLTILPTSQSVWDETDSIGSNSAVLMAEHEESEREKDVEKELEPLEQLDEVNQLREAQDRSSLDIKNKESESLGSIPLDYTTEDVQNQSSASLEQGIKELHSAFDGPRHQITNVKNTNKGDNKGLSDRLSIPSFSGSLPNPFEIYEQCIKDREMEVDDEPNPQRLGESVSTRAIGEPSNVHESNELSLSDEINSTSTISKEVFTKESSDKSWDQTNSLQKKPSKCFPTLLDIMEYFTKSIKGDAISESGDILHEEMVEEEETEVDWTEMMNFKWRSPVEKRVHDETFYCQFNATKFIEQLRKSNIQYMRNHPEMSAMISLILREISLKKPESGFVTFIRDIVFDKRFAKKLTSYLAVNNKGYRRINNICDENCHDRFKKEAPHMFNFDKPSSEYWKEWGVDYKGTWEKYGPEADRFAGDVHASGDGVDDDANIARDSWDLSDLLEKFSERKTKQKETDIKSGWSRFNKKLAKEELQDLMKENNRVTALTNDLNWEPPDLRSSCQKMFLKRYIIDRKKP